MEGIRCGDESRALPLLQPLLLSWTACSSYTLPHSRSRLLEETIARTLPLFAASMDVSWSRQTTNARLTLENPPRTRTQLADVSVDTRDFTITRIPAEGERKELSLPIIDNTRPTAYWLPRSVFQELLYNEVPSWPLLLFFFCRVFWRFRKRSTASVMKVLSFRVCQFRRPTRLYAVHILVTHGRDAGFTCAQNHGRMRQSIVSTEREIVVGVCMLVP